MQTTIFSRSNQIAGLSHQPQWSPRAGSFGFSQRTPSSGSGINGDSLRPELSRNPSSVERAREGQLLISNGGSNDGDVTARSNVSEENKTPRSPSALMTLGKKSPTVASSARGREQRSARQSLSDGPRSGRFDQSVSHCFFQWDPTLSKLTIFQRDSEIYHCHFFSPSSLVHSTFPKMNIFYQVLQQWIWRRRRRNRRENGFSPTVGASEEIKILGFFILTLVVNNNYLFRWLEFDLLFVGIFTGVCWTWITCPDKSGCFTKFENSAVKLQFRDFFWTSWFCARLCKCMIEQLRIQRSAVQQTFFSVCCCCRFGKISAMVCCGFEFFDCPFFSRSSSIMVLAGPAGREDVSWLFVSGRGLGALLYLAQTSKPCFEHL